MPVREVKAEKNPLPTFTVLSSPHSFSPALESGDGWNPLDQRVISSLTSKSIDFFKWQVYIVENED